MPSKLTRQPYTECHYSWSLDVGGVSGGEGVVSDAQCSDLAGDFTLDWKACSSQGDRLIWEGDCFSGESECATYRLDVAGVSGIDCADTYNGTFVMSPSVETYLFGETQCVWRSPGASGTDPFINSETCECGENQINQTASVWTFFGGSFENGLIAATADGTGQPVLYVRSPAGWISGCRPPCTTAPVTPPPTITFTRYGTNLCGTWPTTIVATRISSPDTGPQQNDRIRSKWHLEYSITDAKWTLRSFNYIDYPVYELLDANPCEGESKTLVLAGRPDDAEDGCGVAPPEVTINRVCAPVAVATERRQRQTSTRLMNHKFHLCGCDCGDQVNDERGCASQCASTTTEGCETYPEEGVECRFPISADCCDYCDDQETSGKHDPPCAYQALFDCDIEHDGEQIAASVVTLRHECFFENSCQWVAVGPSPNEEDGFVGSQPVCATCNIECPSGCSWSAWSLAPCPDVGCGPALCEDGTQYQLEFPSFEVTFYYPDQRQLVTHIIPSFTHQVPSDFVSVVPIINSNGTVVAQFNQWMRVSKNCVDLTISHNVWPNDFFASYKGNIQNGDCPETIIFSIINSSTGSPITASNLPTITAVKI